MADNFLERQRMAYEEKKQQMQKNHKIRIESVAKRMLRSHDDYPD